MAVWQFQCKIIPLSKNIDKWNHDEMGMWKETFHPAVNIDFLEREKSWSTNIVQYGKIDETCIEFYYDKDQLEEIECRFDLRILTKPKLIQILNYVQSIRACFLVGDKVYPPELEIMTTVMKQSEANQFCKNSLEYFRNKSNTKE